MLLSSRLLPTKWEIMTITPTIDTVSMLQAYRQIHADKKEENFGITLDSLEPAQESDSVSTLDLQHEIAQMKAAWLVDSGLTITSSPDGGSISLGDLNLWDFFDHKQAGFRDSIAVLHTNAGVLNFDAIMQKERELFDQNPRYADTMYYRYETNVYELDNGILIERYYKPEYDIQISVFHSIDGKKVSFDDNAIRAVILTNRQRRLRICLIKFWKNNSKIILIRNKQIPYCFLKQNCKQCPK